MRSGVRSLLPLTVGVVLGVALSSGWSGASSLLRVDTRVADAYASLRADRAVRSGTWIVSTTGALAWLGDDSSLPTDTTVADAVGYARMSAALDTLNKELECQMNGCGAR